MSEAKVAKHEVDDEVPFARRAREEGKMFRGGKTDGTHRSSTILS